MRARAARILSVVCSALVAGVLGSASGIARGGAPHYALEYASMNAGSGNSTGGAYEMRSAVSRLPTVPVDEVGPYQFVPVFAHDFARAPAIRMTGPVDGDLFYGWDPLTIEWEHDVRRAGLAARFVLVQNGQELETLGTDISLRREADFATQVPLMPHQYNYGIRVVSLRDPRLYDTVHSIEIRGGVVLLTSPRGAEQWQTGQGVTLEWASHLETAGSAVRFELWRGTNKVLELAEDSNPDGRGAISITVPNVPPRSDYLIRVTSQWNATYFDFSDDFLTILGGDPPDAGISAEAWLRYP